MHNVAERDIDAITRPTVFLSYTAELKIMELANSKIDSPENHQYNGTTLMVNTHPYPPHSPPEDTLLASAAPLHHPRVEDGDVNLQA